MNGNILQDTSNLIKAWASLQIKTFLKSIEKVRENIQVALIHFFCSSHYRHSMSFGKGIAFSDFHEYSDLNLKSDECFKESKIDNLKLTLEKKEISEDDIVKLPIPYN